MPLCTATAPAPSPSVGAGRAADAELFSVAPMMDYTDRHFRHMMRLVSRRAVLYSEMVVANAVHHTLGQMQTGSNEPMIDRWYACSDGHDFGAPRDVLQLGGSEAFTLASASRSALAFPYSAINLNCGCPSERVAGAGAFGASLMRNPEHVASLCAAMGEAVGGKIPITVKCRIGVDDDDSYEQLRNFVDVVSGAGVSHFIVHARKAILNMKLTPAENRVVPPLRHDIVHALVADYESQGIRFTLNGGIGSLPDAEKHLTASPRLEGIMIGRDVCNRPFYYAHVDRVLYSATGAPLADGGLAPSRGEVLTAYAAYAREQLRLGARENGLIKPIHNLFFGVQGARAFRRHLSVLVQEKGARAAVLSFEEAAAHCIPDYAMSVRADAEAWDAPEREWDGVARPPYGGDEGKEPQQRLAVEPGCAAA